MVAQKVRIWLIAFIAFTFFMACINLLRKENVTITFGKENLRITAGVSGNGIVPETVPLFPTEKVYASTVNVRQTTCSGTGVCIGRGQILTAYHCVNKAEPIWVNYNNHQDAAVITKLDVGYDLALLTYSPTESPTVLSLATHTPQTGTSVTSVGWADTQKTTLWNMTDLGPYAGFQRMVDRPFALGRSGGAILNPQGEIVGITTANLTTNGLYTDLDKVRSFLGGN